MADEYSAALESALVAMLKPALGGGMTSAVVEFEGTVVLSADVEWGWKGPSRAGKPAKFEARAEYVNQVKGWQLFEPLGIYPL